jgi:hypothetical protein
VSYRIRSITGLVVTAGLVLACTGTPFATGPVTPASIDTGAPATTPRESRGMARIPSVAGAPRPLAADTYLSPEGFAPALAVTVPDGWFGGGGSSGWGVGQGLNEVEQRYEAVGLEVGVIPTPYDDAVAAFRQIDGLIRQGEPSVGKLAGWESTTFESHAAGEPVLIDEVAPGADIGRFSYRQIFVDADGSTLFIRTEVFEQASKPELELVLASLAPA